jgi:hypothetical protein
MAPRRFAVAYVTLAVLLALSGAATWKVAGHRPGPLAPGAVTLVDRFLTAVQQGDLRTACHLFDALPACAQTGSIPSLVDYKVLPAEPAVGGVDVPAILDGEYVLFSIAPLRHHGYRIKDLVADPSGIVASPSLGLAA